MLKTNSREARENIRNYIMKHFDPTGYPVNQNPATFEEAAKIILTTFEEEKRYSNEYVLYHGLSKQDLFVDWCQGLPSILDTCYYYNRSAVDDLALILEQTPKEKSRFDENESELLLSRLIYRELIKGATK